MNYFGTLTFLWTRKNRDFYFTSNNQIVEFDYRRKPTEKIMVKVGYKGIPISTREQVVRGKFLRNGRVFSNRERAEAYLRKYQKHSV